ncbi:hypothetical protein [Xanthomonas arboricola]|uniref:hypothetical protein n=1 Tax=Xanthomonas arboricola TaxID=56448 RepID=UPI000F8DA02F|nr:hypothetical protein [Xanthomonas arboricola]
MSEQGSDERGGPPEHSRRPASSKELRAGSSVNPEKSAELLNRLIESQSKDLEFRTQQLDVERNKVEIEHQKVEFEQQKDKNAYDFGIKALAAQAEDRKHARETSRQEKRDSHRMLTGILIIIAGLVGYALFLDKDQIAMELVKAIVFLSAGAAAGYGLAKKSEKSEDKVDASPAE